MKNIRKIDILIFVVVAINIIVIVGGFFWMRAKVNWQTALNVEKMDKLLEKSQIQIATARKISQWADEQKTESILSELKDNLKNNSTKLEFLLDKTGSTGKSKPNILLIANDTLRGDCLGFNGNQDVLTPNLDRFASQSINFKNAISQAGWTMPSMTSILTGQYPISHGRFTRHRVKVLDESIVRIQEVFQNAGYFTMAIVGKSWTQFHEATDRGFNQIFFIPDDTGKESVTKLLSFLRQNKARPFFVFFHILNPHDPYLPLIEPFYAGTVLKKFKKNPELKERMIQGTLTGNMDIARASYQTYLREIEEVDQQYGRLFNYLEKSPDHIFNWDEDIIVFTADHGEEFEYENGSYRHGFTPYIETMRVPLIFKLPGRAPATVNRYCENSGLYKTLLDFLKIPMPQHDWPKLKPQSVIDEINGHDIPATERYALSEAISHGCNLPEMKSIIRGDGIKLIYNTKTKKKRLYDLNSDPGEDKNLLSKGKNNQLAQELFEEMGRRTLINYAYR